MCKCMCENLTRTSSYETENSLWSVENICQWLTWLIYFTENGEKNGQICIKLCDVFIYVYVINL